MTKSVSLPVMLPVQRNDHRDSPGGKDTSAHAVMVYFYTKAMSPPEQ